ncbi:MAG TPA: type II secretion system minor pseudopilin GspI [Pseudomonadales bacterium]|nr:type II secretion system minor pseudopilin GspI [Pseudomonadales bacterium]
MQHRHVSTRQHGFTLIEVLVALAIVSIALLAALRAAAQGTAHADALRARVLASWVAENLLAEHRARLDWLPTGILHGTSNEGGSTFKWREEIIATPNLAFRRIDIFITDPADATLAHVTGFLVNPPAATP